MNIKVITTYIGLWILLVLSLTLIFHFTMPEQKPTVESECKPSIYYRTDF